MNSSTEISNALAKAFVLGPMDEEVMIANASKLYFDGARPRWLRPVAKYVAEACAEMMARPLSREVAEQVRDCPAFQRVKRKNQLFLGQTRVPVAATMQPGVGAPQGWKVPPATDWAELALLLELDIDDLGWLSNPGSETRHYHFRWHRKRSSPHARLIEIPKPLLKETQRIILSKILDQIPAHEAACGFQRGKSILDFVSPHSEKPMVLKMDFRDYFTMIHSGRVLRFFMTAGYPEQVAFLLTDLCTNLVDSGELDEGGLDWNTRLNLIKSHLPQGAPTSPALANLCSFRLDCRLLGLAKAAGASYTRYADDLLFSGGDGFRRGCEAFHLKVLTIAIEEGFRINPRKTRMMKGSQRQFAGGLVVNRKPNLPRKDYDQLKAILTNCVRFGWQSQNREEHPDFRAHLEGRIGWVARVNLVKGQKLRRLFEEIDWQQD